MSEAMAGRAWIGVTDGGVVLARPGADESELLVDRPATGRFMAVEPASWDEDAPVVDGVELQPIAPFPARMAHLAGWYEDGDRQVLLTQIPEAFFGEPMVLLAE